MQGIAYLSPRPRFKRLVTLSSFRGKFVLEWVFLLSQHRVFLSGIISLQTWNSYQLDLFPILVPQNWFPSIYETLFVQHGRRLPSDGVQFTPKTTTRIP